MPLGGRKKSITQDIINYVYVNFLHLNWFNVCKRWQDYNFFASPYQCGHKSQKNQQYCELSLTSKKGNSLSDGSFWRETATDMLLQVSQT